MDITDRHLGLTGAALIGCLLAATPGTAQELEGGRELYRRFACVECHGAAAEGGFGPRLAGTALSLEAVRREVRAPGGIMPRYPEDKLSDEELERIYAYLRSLSPETVVFPSWFGSDLLNLPTPATPPPRTLEVHFTHRFSESIADAGREGLWGLDSFGFPGFYLAYGITDRISGFGGRTANLATWEYGAKIALLREGELPLPVAAAAVVGGTYLDADGIPNSSRFTLELPVGLRVHDRLSVLGVPLLVTDPDELGRAGSQGQAVAMGLGMTFRMTPGLSLDAEWIRNLSGFRREGAVDQWQVGLAIRVGGHLFQIIVTNSVLTTPDFMAGGTLETGVKGNARLGFNLVRTFKFVRTEAVE